MLRFKRLASLKLLLSMTPLFAVLGPHDRAPFADLVQAWMLDRDLTTGNHLDLFLDTFWNELYYRSLDNQFDEATIAKGHALLLLDKMMERRKAYVSALNQMCSPVRTPSRIPFIARQSRTSVVEYVFPLPQPSVDSPKLSLFSRVPGVSLTVSEYSEECMQAIEQVRMTFESLSLAPRTYLTPETLYTVLFSEPFHNVSLVRYLMIRCCVVTVCANPLKEVPVPVMEYALRTGKKSAIKLLLSIGATLHDHFDGGTVAEDMFLFDAVSSKEVAPLLEIWKKREEQRKGDPSVSYGILRTVRSAT
ncbi:uncharacterized protein Tco025E_07422 [Trypanosoma conorhini]|uniref:Ankyrin repeat protein n=1 Tax=Trypanosoma conorhini TaxID=83891 RepID=A0A3R7M1A5_9TRYP|nr:uncharacterized protein Tco025E_07422 [Trypanosoma conorhini]RNF07202.1 hypothetical protein Tco025E_07422 [Trypanosoma conorhini]